MTVEDYDHRTPLHIAASEGNIEIVRFLMKNGAGIHPREGSQRPHTPNVCKRKWSRSVIFYCSDVWLTSSTSRKLWTVINSIHYKALRISVHDHRQRINREKLDIMCQRANPKQWSKYSSSSLVIKCLQRKEPAFLVDNLRTTLYFERRHPHIGKFYDNSKGKIGRQKLCNSLQHMAAIQFNWLGLHLGNATIRSSLKKTFFGYLDQWVLQT